MVSKVRIFLGLWAMFALAFGSPVFGQMDQPPTDETMVEDEFSEEDLPYYSYGTVASVSADTLTLNEIIYEEDEEKEMQVAYTLNAETVYEGYTAAGEIAANDEVEIYYLENAGTKLATLVIKSEYFDEEYEEYEDVEAPEGAAPAESPAE